MTKSLRTTHLLDSFQQLRTLIATRCLALLLHPLLWIPGLLLLQCSHQGVQQAWHRHQVINDDLVWHCTLCVLCLLLLLALLQALQLLLLLLPCQLQQACKDGLIPALVQREGI